MATMKAEITIKENKDLQNKIIAKAGEIRRNAIMSVIPKAINKAKMIVRGAVDDYYESYSPVVYQRQESLYSVMNVELTGDGFDLLFSAANLSGGHRVGNDYIYDVMFKKGYHGGAPHNGGYYWRFPSPQTASSFGIPPYITWYPFGPAPQSASPWEQIQADWYDYINTEGKRLLLNAIVSEAVKIKREVL